MEANLRRCSRCVDRGGRNRTVELKHYLCGHDAATALETDLEKFQNGTSAEPGFGAINRDASRYVTMVQSADVRPSSSVTAIAVQLCNALGNDLQRWRQINETKLPQLNQELLKNKLPALPLVTVGKQPVCPN